MVVAVVAVLAYFLLDRLLVYRELAEKTAMELTAGSLQSALNIQFAHALVRGDTLALEALGRENPVRWLMRPPENYAGEHAAPAEGAIAPGNWYFDSQSRELVYLVKVADHFRAESGKTQVRYRVKLVTEEIDGKREVSAVLLERLDDYNWTLSQPGNQVRVGAEIFAWCELRLGRGYIDERSGVYA